MLSVTAVALEKVESLSDAVSTTAEMPSHRPSPRSDISDVWEEEGSCHLVVRSTFLHMDDGQSLMQRYRKLRRAKTEFALERAMEDLEVYELGTAPRPHVAPLAPPTPTTAPVKTACGGVAEPGHRMSYRKERTTVMLRNLPNNYTREMFLEMLDSEGFRGSYDFVYLPCDFHRKANLGYAFVNMVDAPGVDALWNTFHGFSAWALPTSKVCEVTWSGPHQGFKAHVERYRNSPVMHKSVPDEYKPVIFKNGLRKPFPAPTKKVKAPF